MRKEQRTSKHTQDGSVIYETAHKYGYIEVRKMLGYDLWALCKKKQWYTHGSNESYEKIIRRVDATGDITTDDIVEIAADIIENSDISVDEFEHVCYELFKICNTFIEPMNAE